MSAARKILFSGPDGSANIDGLIASLRKTSPGTMARLDDSGGRIHGEATASDHKGAATSPNASLTTKVTKC